MTTLSSSRLGLAAVFLATAAACGSGTGTGTLSVHLVDGPGDFQQINLHVLEVSIHSDSEGWIVLGSPDRTVDLLTLTGGVSATLAGGATVPAGHYTQMRLLLGSGNTVMLADGSTHDLKVPSGLQSGVKLVVNFDVAAGTTKDVFIDFDGHRSVFLHAAGASGQYILRPVIRAFDLLATGSISGTLSGTTGEGSAPLAGAEVTAQVLDATGVASIVRTATSGMDGKYTLDLLPVGFSYYVVGQPVVGGTAYAAKSSGPIAIDAATPTGAYDALFTVVASTGGVGGTITPPAGADDADLVDARQALDTGGGTTQSLIVRTTAGVVSGGAESYLIDHLPPGVYSLSDTRRTLDAATGTETVKTSPAVAATVVASGTATANLVLPP